MRWAIIMAVLCAVSCSGGQKVQTLDFEAMIRSSQCDMVLQQLNEKANMTASEQGAFALCKLQVAPTVQTGETVAQYLINAGSEDASVAMVEWAVALPDASDGRFVTLMSEILLVSAREGATTHNSPSWRPSVVSATVSFLGEWIKRNHPRLDAVRLNEIVDESIRLLGGTGAMESGYDAWMLFKGMAEISLALWDGQNVQEMNLSQMRQTIAVVEHNPLLSVPAKCDLGSPYDRLKSTLSKNKDLLGALERSVNAAMGCSKGRYAPAKGE